MFLIEVAVLVNCWIFSTWLVVDVVKNSHLCSNCLVICSEATSSLSVDVPRVRLRSLNARER